MKSSAVWMSEFASGAILICLGVFQRNVGLVLAGAFLVFVGIVTLMVDLRSRPIGPQVTPQQRTFRDEWPIWRIVAIAVFFPITIYQVFHNWGEWLFLGALGLCWFLFAYRIVRDFRSLPRSRTSAVGRGSRPEPC
jgi:hypothetical protein